MTIRGFSSNQKQQRKSSNQSNSLFFDIVKTSLYAFLGWVFIAPLAFLIPKKRNRIIIIGRNKGEYLDNTKYLHLYLSENETKLEYYWLTEQKSTYNELSKHYPNILYHVSMDSITKLLTANIVVVDAMDWQYKLKYHLLIRAKKVQLWHGVGFKKILSLNKNFRADLTNLYQNLRAKLVGRTPTYDLFISTSDFYSKNTFGPAFRPKRMEDLGYPRNDYLIRQSEKQNINISLEDHQLILAVKKQGAKIITYMPTFRDQNSKMDNAFDLDHLNDFAKQHHFHFIIKGHILSGGTKQELSNIHFYPNDKDIYPLLSQTDLLITDYSSIYMDFLFLNRPVLFFPYDYEQYMEEDNIQFDYNWITPGEKCKTQAALQEQMVKILIEGRDTHKQERQEIFNLAFKYKDANAAKRITKTLEELC
jgi:CDP-glycerol glycerophosphotransferase